MIKHEYLRIEIKNYFLYSYQQTSRLVDCAAVIKEVKFLFEDLKKKSTKSIMVVAGKRTRNIDLCDRNNHEVTLRFGGDEAMGQGKLTR